MAITNVSHVSSVTDSPSDKISEFDAHGDGDSVLETEPAQTVDENSCSSHFSITECLRGPEDPDLVDRSSQSSLNSQDETGFYAPTYTEYTFKFVIYV